MEGPISCRSYTKKQSLAALPLRPLFVLFVLSWEPGPSLAKPLSGWSVSASHASCPCLPFWSLSHLITSFSVLSRSTGAVTLALLSLCTAVSQQLCYHFAHSQQCWSHLCGIQAALRVVRATDTVATASPVLQYLLCLGTSKMPYFCICNTSGSPCKDVGVSILLRQMRKMALKGIEWFTRSQHNCWVPQHIMWKHRCGLPGSDAQLCHGLGISGEITALSVPRFLICNMG